MPLKEPVCSLEYAKKLKKLGAKQESLFYWIERTGGSFLVLSSEIGDEVDELSVKNYVSGEIIGFYSAFTCGELGEMLPTLVSSWQRSDDWACKTNYTKGKEEPLLTYMFTADTEADARAKMLIYLLENNLIKLRELN